MSSNGHVSAESYNVAAGHGKNCPWLWFGYGIMNFLLHVLRGGEGAKSEGERKALK